MLYSFGTVRLPEGKRGRCKRRVKESEARRLHARRLWESVLPLSSWKCASGTGDIRKNGHVW